MLNDFFQQFITALMSFFGPLIQGIKDFFSQFITPPAA